MNAAHILHCFFALYQCCNPTDGMEGAVKSVKVEVILRE